MKRSSCEHTGSSEHVVRPRSLRSLRAYVALCVAGGGWSVVKGDAYERVQKASLLVVRERAAALDRAVEARKKLAAAQSEYSQAVLEASALGIPNTKLARSMGVSETAVRNFIARRKNP